MDLDKHIIERVRFGRDPSRPLSNDDRLRAFLRKLTTYREVEPNNFFLAGRAPALTKEHP
jgi:hypothetical protein